MSLPGAWPRRLSFVGLVMGVALGSGVACRTAAEGFPASGRGTSEPRPRASVKASSPARADPSRTRGSSTTPAQSQIDRDVDTILGGNFSPDHIGPQAYDAIVARYEASPAEYVAGVQRHHTKFPVGTPASRSYLTGNGAPAFLRRLYAHAPRAVERTAAVLLPRYEALPPTPPDPADTGWSTRRTAQVRQMFRLAGGIDRRFESDWPRATADQICVDGATVTLIAECTCTDHLACSATAAGDVVTVELRIDPRRPGTVCRDCVRSWTTCTFSSLDPARRINTVVNGAPGPALGPGVSSATDLGSCARI